jgi:hypothetical protein
MIVGEKRRTKSKGKTAKVTKHGLRPHEQREQQDAFKGAGAQVLPSSSGGKPPRT